MVNILNLYITLLVFISKPLFSNAEEELNQIITEFMINIFNDTIYRNRDNITENCFNNLYLALTQPDDLYMMKLVKDSAKNKNDLGSYQDCFSISYISKNKTYTSSIKDNLTYVVINIQKNSTQEYMLSDVRYEAGEFLFGVCLIKGCNHDDVRIVFNSLNEDTKFFPDVNINDITVYDMQDAEIENNYIFYVSLIPIVIIIVIILFSIFPIIPIFLFKCCLNKKVDNNSRLISKSQVDNYKINELRKCFDFYDNFEEFKNDKTDDNGLIFLNGLRGISIIFTVLGFTFRQLYVSPIKIFCNISFVNMITSYTFSFIIFGRRFGPKLLFSISGFLLIYKFLSYLDEKIDNFDNNNKTDIYFAEKKEEIMFSTEVTIKERSEKRNTSVKISNFNESKYTQYSYSEFRKNIKTKRLIRFIFLQSYKYILYVICILSFKYSFYYFIALINNPGPVWLIMKKMIVDNFNYIHILSAFTLISTCSYTTYFPYDMFWIVTNEIIFFIFGSISIFIFYKKNLRIDIFIILSILLIFISQFILLYTTFPNFLPSLSFQKHDFYYILKNPLYNISSFMIGEFFGLINYCIQKCINKESFKEKNNRLLIIPYKFIQIFKKHTFAKVIIISISSLIGFIFIFIGFVFIYDILFHTSDPFMNQFYNNIYVNFYFLYDVEIGLILIYLMIMPLFLIGDNFVLSILKHRSWNIFAKSYYIFALFFNVIILYIFYQSETRVKLDFFNIIFFSLLNLMIITIIGVFFSVGLEIPMKKLNRFVMSKNNPENDDVVVASISSINKKVSE